LLGLLRHRDFALLWLAGAVSAAGDWVILVALPVQVYALTGSTLATGGSFAAYVLPRLLFGAVGGALVDRWDRRRTMMLADLTRAALTLPLLLVRSPDTVWLVYIVVGPRDARATPRAGRGGAGCPTAKRRADGARDRSCCGHARTTRAPVRRPPCGLAEPP
jgi:MFS family permease